MKVRKTMCKTCPFRDDSFVKHLRPYLIERSLKEGRICHSSGGNDVVHNHATKTPVICRGSRNFQLTFLHTIGFLPEATDEAWCNKCKELGIKPDNHE